MESIPDVFQVRMMEQIPLPLGLQPEVRKQMNLPFVEDREGDNTKEHKKGG